MDGWWHLQSSREKRDQVVDNQKSRPPMQPRDIWAPGYPELPRITPPFKEDNKNGVHAQQV